MKARYSYDAHNRRTRKVVASDPSTELRAGEQPFDQAQGSRATSDYTYSAWQVVAEYEESAIAREYIYGSGIDSPVATITYKDGKAQPFDPSTRLRTSKLRAQKFFYQTDHLGSITAITDEEGKVVKKYRYDAYGKLIELAKNGAKTGGISNPYLYTGRRYDAETGLYYYRNRYYSPKLGRFVTRDPLKYIDGPNLYAYVTNNPLSFLDPMGTNERTNPAVGGNAMTGEDYLETEDEGERSNSNGYARFRHSGGSAIGLTRIKDKFGYGVGIRIRNVNVLGTTVSVSEIRRGPSCEHRDTRPAVIVLPGQEVYFNFSDFGAEPMTREFEISTQSDAFVVIYEIESTWVPGMPSNP